MTRVQALNRAIHLLNKDAENREIIRKLIELRDELPLNHWTELSIKDAVEQFILDSGRPPTATDFRKKELPPHTVIRQKYGMSLSCWLNEQYPQDGRMKEKRKKSCIQSFKTDYFRVKPASAREYNLLRDKFCKSWQTIARYQGADSWSSLLKALSLPKYAGSSETVCINAIVDTSDGTKLQN